jgi:HAD superfamily hydrolase (TIGR01549 family)
MYDCVIFDIDGTILDTREASLLSVQRAYFMESGKLLPFEEIDFAFGTTTLNTAKRLNVADAQTFIARIDENYHGLAHKNRIFPGMEETIRRLYALSVYLGVVTSKTIWEYEHDFAHFGLKQYFKTAICVEDTARHKPDPQPLFEFFARSGQSGKTALYIGDSINDQLCADAAGVDFALAEWGAVIALKAEHVLKTPEDLFKIL